MYLYQDLNRRPSTIDGYRTAIVDSMGPTGHHIAQSSDLHRLLSSFHRDRPKWNLSVLNELTKAPFEPMKDTDLKHLTLKTAFLLALASGKHLSKIHAWVANKVSNLGQWEKVALFPSSDFIAKNQLAREGSQSVSPVTVPALTTIVDRQFKEDRTLLGYKIWQPHSVSPRRSKSGYRIWQAYKIWRYTGAGPEVLSGSNQRPERVSIPPFHLLQERTHLRHQTRYSFFLVETNHSTLL